jgi:endonuclease/exonuclease/phosphatase family metal-dependent hydrolase
MLMRTYISCILLLVGVLALSVSASQRKTPPLQSSLVMAGQPTLQSATNLQATSTQLRVLSWNLQFGEGTDAIRNYDRIATRIANINPDIMGLCEIPPGDVATLVSLLNQKTGYLWYSHFVPKFPGCDEGNLILSKYQLVSVNYLFLSANRSIAQATINVGGVNVNFFATHLDDQASANRVTEVGQLIQWATNFSEPRIFTGDFNSGPDTTEILLMTQSYRDSWSDMLSLGTATAYPDNPLGMHTRTRRGRIDYVFYSGASASLAARQAKIPDLRDLNNPNVVITLGTLDDKGVRPSDHNAMVTDFEVGSASPVPTPTPIPTPTPVSGAPTTFQFEASSYSVAENAPAQIVVTRSGDLSQTSSVNYATADNSALQRSDYILTSGTLTFAPGETKKTFLVLIVDDGYAESTETLTVTLTPGYPAILGNPGTASLSILDNDGAGSTTNPLSNASFFVQEHYLDFLNRQPDSSGLNFWSNEILSCAQNAQCLDLKRINVSAAFFLSIEFQETGFLACLTNWAALGAFPSYGQFMHDSQALRSNFVYGQPGADQQLELNKRLFFNEFINRPEFHSRYDGMSNAQFVDTLGGTTGSSLTASERQTLIDGLNSGVETRATVLRKFAEKPAFKARQFNAIFVLIEYYGYLRREPDAAGFNFWLGKLNSFNGDFIKADMVKAFIQSTEYSARFGPGSMQ